MENKLLWWHPLLLTISITLLLGCERKVEVSVARAKDHVAKLSAAAATDVEEVRVGLPKGAPFLREYLAAGKYEDPNESREVLEKARNKVQDLRVAKSTFFAIIDRTGAVVRSDQEHDALAGKNLFGAFPELRGALTGKYVETRGEIAEAAGVRGRKDAQWVAGVGVGAPGEIVGVYVTGWSWSSYAYRLENQLRSMVRSSLEAREKEPLVYVYVVVGKDVFGAPVSPEVNARAIGEERFLEKAPGNEVVTAQREITGREFGLAFQRVPLLGSDVGVVVVRSET